VAAPAAQASELWGLVSESEAGQSAATVSADRGSRLTSAFLTLLVALVILVLVLGFLVMFTNLL
jgi:hypothetical protein